MFSIWGFPSIPQTNKNRQKDHPTHREQNPPPKTNKKNKHGIACHSHATPQKCPGYPIITRAFATRSIYDCIQDIQKYTELPVIDLQRWKWILEVFRHKTWNMYINTLYYIFHVLPTLNLQHVICFLEESYLKSVALHCYMFDVRSRQNNAEPVC